MSSLPAKSPIKNVRRAAHTVERARNLRLDQATYEDRRDALGPLSACFCSFCRPSGKQSLSTRLTCRDFEGNGKKKNQSEEQSRPSGDPEVETGLVV